MLEDFSEEEILQAAKTYLEEKLNWSEDPIKVFVDEDSILLIYEEEGENYVDNSIHDTGIYAVWVRGNKKKIQWIEFEKYNGLKKYLPLPYKL